jgi:hypothetical protein
MAKRKQPERAEQQQIVTLLTSMGHRVWRLGTTRRTGDYHGTMMDPGLPDLIVRLKQPSPSTTPPWRRLEIEVKAPGGRLRPEQEEWRDFCEAEGIDHIVGGLDDVIAWLTREGYLRSSDVPHYRVKEVTHVTRSSRQSHPAGR